MSVKFTREYAIYRIIANANTHRINTSRVDIRRDALPTAAVPSTTHRVTPLASGVVVQQHMSRSPPTCGLPRPMFVADATHKTL
eukprot:scaffold100531_cov109-Cyclotella_meneghiniana.AAC.1